MDYKIRSSNRARALSVTVYPGGAVVVTKPRWVGDGAVERFVAQKWDWIARKVEELRHVQPRARAVHTKREYKKRKEEARKLVEQKLTQWGRIYAHEYTRVSIRNQKSRWGSCSKKGTLSFNYRLLFLPEQLVDYVVVHELCHLKHFNHSPKFWAEVARTVPDHKARRKELLKNPELWL